MTDNQRFKTTFDVDTADLHLDFKDACNRNGSDMTKELNKFITGYVEDFKKNGAKKGKEGTNV